MRAIFRAPAQFLADVRKDLMRPHAFAAERVGFISVRAAWARQDLLILAQHYHPVADHDYDRDPTVGAMMGQEAIRKALEVSLLQPVGMFHVHVHEHEGRPGFSSIDLREQLKFVPDFFKVQHKMPHGAIVLSRDRLIGRLWQNGKTITDFFEYNTTGSKVEIDAKA